MSVNGALPDAYYGLPITAGESSSPQFHLIFNLQTDELLSPKKPALILISRPDVYDGSRGLLRYCNSQGYTKLEEQPHVFTAWKE